MNKKIIALLLTALLLAPFFPTTAFAAQTHELTTTDIDLSACADGDKILVKSGADVMISNMQGLTKNIEIVCEQGVTLHLYNVIIDAGETANKCALSFTGSRNSLILSGTNILISGANEPGIRVEIYNTLDIYDDDTGSEDYLYATGGSRAAGIGGGNTSSAGGIYIYRGNIVAAGGLAAAGIGSGADPAEEYAYIRIYGGTVNVKGGEAYGSTDVNCGAGIGGGRNCEGGTIIIEGGDVTAIGGANAAGIGGGGNGGGGEITISAGTVIASTPYLDDNITGGAAIGSGAYGEGGEITISGGTVNATANLTGAAIGSGSYAGTVDIKISGGTVNATNTYGGVGIGSGYCSESAGTITISGGTVNAESTVYGAGIGCALHSTLGTITISNGVVTATGANDSPGIGSAAGGGNRSRVEAINITGGTVTASGGDYAAGIGSGNRSRVETINITGGTVTASGGQDGAGIGSGYNSSVETINITGGTVTATGGNNGAGIGSGNGLYSYSSVNSINITGGTVTATGGYYGAGVGSGYSNSTVNIINISECTLTATGGTRGSGVGSGHSDSTVNTINISECTLTATGGSRGSGVGSELLVIRDSVVFAEGNDLNDIESSSFYITGISKVFLLNGTVNTVSVPGYTLYDYLEAAGGKVYGETIPPDWSGAYSYLYSVEINYDDNSGSGTKTEIVPYGYPAAISDSGGFSMPGHTFLEWDTNPNGSITKYYPGDTVTLTSDLKLYAIWSPITSASLTLSSNSETLAAGESSALVAAILPADSADKTVTWTSTNTDAATVSASGVITAKAAGTTTITAKNGEASDTCAVNVYQPATSVDIDADSLSLDVGGTAKLNASLLPANAESTPVYWSTNDGTVASVDDVGLVTAIGVGTTTITATANGYTATCSVSVSGIPVSTVSLNYGSKSVYVDDVFALNAIVIPDDATDAKVTWESSDYTVATVNSSGVMTAQGLGTCTITATAGGVTDTCKITVSPQPDIGVDSVNISVESAFTAVLYVGDTLNLSAAVIPSDADNQSLVWKSSDESVLTVSSYGLVKALSEGEATVTVTAGGASDSYSITVKDMDEASSPTVAPTSTGTAPTPLPSDGDVMLNFNIDTQNLPYGAEYILLPDGEVMPLSDKSTMTVCVNQCRLNDGVLQITALDADKNALGAVEVSADKSGINVIFIVLIALGTLLAGIGGTLAVLKIVINRK